MPTQASSSTEDAMSHPTVQKYERLPAPSHKPPITAEITPLDPREWTVHYSHPLGPSNLPVMLLALRINDTRYRAARERRRMRTG